MRGSVAQDQGSKARDKGDAVSRTGGGYTLKSTEESGRASMVTRRGAGQGWELRLGKVQFAVWLGLAVGSIVGAYCVGFFSGRYVGFETARESSGVEVAKLPVADPLIDGAPQNPSSIYERLKAPAVLEEEKPEEMAPPRGLKRNSVAREAAPAYKEPQILNQESDKDEDRPMFSQKQDRNAQEAAVVSDGEQAATASDIEGLFETDASGELIIGDDGEESPEKLPQSVKMLGSKGDVPPQSSGAANSLLEQRIASNRGGSSEELKGAKIGQEVKPKALSQGGKAGSTSSAVRSKGLPSGFFAQVAAPKSQAEADKIAKKLKQSGFPVAIESTSVSGKSFYRVLVGPEENKVQADRLVSQLKSEPYIAGQPFIRHVK